MDLKALVERYRALAGSYGRPLHLSEFGLPKAELERIFSAYDEDYHISRYLKLSRCPDQENQPRAGGERLYTVNAFEYSHVAIEAGIEAIL
ncbi:MAG: hypothetical protein ACE5H2_01070 [Terriglobia bacterium]